MKTCPICNTTLFDDMEVCYGCMYSFGSKPELERKAQKSMAETEVMAPVAIEATKEGEMPAMLSNGGGDAGPSSEPLPLALLTQAASTMPGWGIRFEMHDETAPYRIWSMELTPPRAEKVG